MGAPKNNEFAIGNSGRSKQWETPEKLQIDIDEYFTKCEVRTIKVYDKVKKTVIEIFKPIPYTIEGLCEVLDCGRHALLNYEKQAGYEEFFTTIKKAKLKIQRNKLERGLDGESNPAVTIFDLKNNHDYKDKTEATNINYNITPTKEESRQIAQNLEDDC